MSAVNLSKRSNYCRPVYFSNTVTVFPCTVCEKCYLSQSHLFHYMNIHGGGDYKCREVANAVSVTATWQYAGEVIQERNRLNVLFVANDLQRFTKTSAGC